MNDDLPTDLMISAQIRIAARQGVPIVVTHRGDSSSGSIYLKINLLNGTAHVLNQVRLEDERVWVYTLSDTPLDEREADKYLESQIDFDPDLWVIEIEDRQGRHWFDGRILKST
ncbi:MAG TPA: DUF1491 domain-containing protein [Rhodospirillaceae bacterium]|nr:DUF1491 domain-containing protein [Rhodospirillaceae bacterium]